jgi:O-antigen/teichoic acid export membrane protein
MVGQVLGIIISFITRVVFLNVLTSDHLGIQGVFTNVLSVISLAELGVGSAIIYSLYKPLANNDIEKVKSLMKLYARAYRAIGIVIFIIGISLLPFIDLIIKDNHNVSNIWTIYLILLINTVISYFFSYKKSLIIADQKSYITSMYRYIYFIVYNIAQIIVLLITGNFLLFLTVQLVLNLIENIMVSRKADRLYPYLLDKNIHNLDAESKSSIFKNVRAIIMHKLGIRLVLSTDNIIISSFIGVYWVGLYANYLLIVNALHTITEQILSSITASIGNMNELESREKNFNTYRSINFANYCIFALISICLLALLKPFITIWIGKNYLLDDITVFLIVLNFYITGMRKVNLTFKDAYGLFRPDRYKPIFEVGINIISSIILLRFWGINGVFLGTLISTLLTSFWIEPYVLYKYGFQKKVISYFKSFILYTLVFIITGYITVLITNLIESLSWGTLILKMLICFIIPGIFFITIYRKTEEFNFIVKALKSIKGEKKLSA